MRFLVALDSCTDATPRIVARHARADSRVRSFSYPKLGKGGVIAATIRRSDADLVGFGAVAHRRARARRRAALRVRRAAAPAAPGRVVLCRRPRPHRPRRPVLGARDPLPAVLSVTGEPRAGGSHPAALAGAAHAAGDEDAATICWSARMPPSGARRATTAPPGSPWAA